MRILKALAAAGMAWAAFGSFAAHAQTEPRIIMRRPLPPVEAPTSPPATCGAPGLPACPDSNCEFVSATWVVGQWSGAACGENGTVTRSVQCMGVTRTGRRVPKSDDFCLQDAAVFAATCSNGGGN